MKRMKQGIWWKKDATQLDDAKNKCFQVQKLNRIQWEFFDLFGKE